MTNTTQKTTYITQDQFAKALIQRINISHQDLSADVTERLRFARNRALGAQKTAQFSHVASFTNQTQGSAVLGGGNRFDWLSRWGSLIPLIALVVGMIVINQFQNDYHAKEMASLDSALLTDDLPPNAYADQGFGQFLKLQTER